MENGFLSHCGRSAVEVEGWSLRSWVTNPTSMLMVERSLCGEGLRGPSKMLVLHACYTAVMVWSFWTVFSEDWMVFRVEMKVAWTSVAS